MFAIGAPDLRPETTWGATPTVGVRLPWLHGELSAFANRVDRFVYFAPELGDDGEPAFDVTARGAFPRYGFRPIGAAFWGADGRVDLAPEALVGVSLSGAMVRAVDRATGGQLVGTPGDSARLAVVIRPPDVRRAHSTHVELTAEGVARQSRVDPSVDLAPAPDGFVLFGLSAATDLDFAGAELRVGFDISNLLDTRYRQYTSLLRYYADQPGRDVRVRAAMDF